jgi:hypothetical protein
MGLVAIQRSKYTFTSLSILVLFLLCASPANPQSGSEVPAGTVLPVRVNHGFSSRNAHAGQPVSGRIMQDVPLPNDSKIPEGAKILGTIVSVSAARKNGDGQITLRFDHLEVNKQKVAIVTNLRALASFMEVEFAQIPETPLGFGTPYVWATTDLIGGDIKYGVGGPVTDAASNTIGREHSAEFWSTSAANPEALVAAS